jgi:3-isopropylmalate dehydratase small subunit
MKFESRTVVLAVDNVDTDQIIPARFLKTTSKTGLGDQLFHDWRYDAAGAPKADFVLNRPDAQGAQVLVAGDNFGCGSSREHAPWAKGRAVRFPIDAFSRHCLLEGVDELGYILQQEPAIAAYERRR